MGGTVEITEDDGDELRGTLTATDGRTAQVEGGTDGEHFFLPACGTWPGGG